MGTLSEVGFRSVPVWAQVVSGRTVSPEPFEFGAGGAVTVLIYLVLLALIGAGVIFFFRRSRPGLTKTGGRLSVLETRMLGGRQFLVVGKYGEKTFLLGVCPGKIEYLCTLPEAASGGEPGEKKAAPKFAGMLRDEEAKGEG